MGQKDITQKTLADYKINLFEIAFLTPEQISLFQSDFGIVADYFVQIRTNRNYKPSNVVIKHVDAVLKLMSVLTDDDRFEQAAQEMNKSKKKSKKGRSGTTMCEVLDKVESRGVARGRKEGIAVGAKEAIHAMQLISQGYTTMEELCEQGIPEEVAEQVVETIS